MPEAQALADKVSAAWVAFARREIRTCRSFRSGGVFIRCA
jgi:hypothetical protein